MIKALWLTSWYPNKLDALNGDFIQRHAKAVSMFCKVNVIHLEADRNNELPQATEITVQHYGNLTETIVLYKIINFPVFGKLFSIIRYIIIFKKQVKKYIAENGKPDIVHVHVPVKAGLIALWLKRRYNIAFVVTEHWAIYNDTAEDAYPKRNFFFKYFTEKILENAAAFLPVSKNLGEAVQQMVAPVSFNAIPNVADTNYFNNDMPFNKENVFRFVHVSTLKYQKNPEGILRAFAKFCLHFPNVQLVMVGEVPQGLLQYAGELNIPAECISFEGVQPYENVAEIVKQSHAMIMFSRFENLPCVIIEALCCGLPVISTNVGGIPELIDKSNGILVNSEDEDALFNAMLDVYQNYKNYNNAAIAEKARNDFSYTVIGEKIVNIYSEIIGNNIKRK